MLWNVLFSQFPLTLKSCAQLFSFLDDDGGRTLSRDEIAKMVGGDEGATADLMSQMEDIPDSANGVIELREWLRFVRKIKVSPQGRVGAGIAKTGPGEAYSAHTVPRQADKKALGLDAWLEQCASKVRLHATLGPHPSPTTHASESFYCAASFQPRDPRFHLGGCGSLRGPPSLGLRCGERKGH
jgi:hypothetical protein